MSSAEMSVLSAALCFTATEPLGFSSTERTLCVPAPSLRLFIVGMQISQVGSRLTLCSFAYMCKHAWCEPKSEPVTGLFMNFQFCTRTERACFLWMEECMQSSVVSNYIHL